VRDIFGSADNFRCLIRKRHAKAKGLMVMTAVAKMTVALDLALA